MTELIRCECGETPRPVAFRLYGDRAWGWGVVCICGEYDSLGTDHFAQAAKRWNQGARLDSSKGDEQPTFRYDIPLRMTLGCEELPEEYQGRAINTTSHPLILCSQCNDELVTLTAERAHPVMACRRCDREVSGR